MGLKVKPVNSLFPPLSMLMQVFLGTHQLHNRREGRFTKMKYSFAKTSRHIDFYLLTNAATIFQVT